MHDAQVVLASGEPLVAQALEGIEHGELRPRLARDRFRDAVRDERLREDCRRPGGADVVDQALQLARAWLGLGGVPGQGELGQTVSRRKVAERGMARDEGAPAQRRRPRL